MLLNFVAGTQSFVSNKELIILESCIGRYQNPIFCYVAEFCRENTGKVRFQKRPIISILESCIMYKQCVFSYSSEFCLGNKKACFKQGACYVYCLLLLTNVCRSYKFPFNNNKLYLQATSVKCLLHDTNVQ